MNSKFYSLIGYGSSACCCLNNIDTTCTSRLRIGLRTFRPSLLLIGKRGTFTPLLILLSLWQDCMHKLETSILEGVFG